MNTFQCDICGEINDISQKYTTEYGDNICEFCIEEIIREGSLGEYENISDDEDDDDEDDDISFEYIHADQEYDYKRLTGYV